MAPTIYLIFYSENSFDKMIPHRIMHSYILHETAPPRLEIKPLHQYPMLHVQAPKDGKTIEIPAYTGDRQRAEEMMNGLARSLPENLDAKGNMIKKLNQIHSAGDFNLRSVSVEVGGTFYWWQIEEFDLSQQLGQTPVDKSKYYGQVRDK
ncbi:hypothetical protein K491DRAFT_719178 [Lophiostoma macrostomum CBS 122681]|uniref:Uncharacterized protein n=1 Tax=Lophiostoma macrostomum CBS 122681 TaxID=1314788 RepID=A0A6A6T062_9PLEO|nr:hypothetical protein K491DRAFT_719178 [Lophiostoma macrostomum CBS 122681]